MRNIFIIHGSYGSPDENWFPWLKHELENLGNKVFVPQFPIPSAIKSGGHKLNEWLNTFKEYEKYVNNKTIFVAHSRGSTFMYNLIPLLKIKVDSMFLVGPFIDYYRWRPDFHDRFDSFQASPYQWNAIKKLVDYIEIYQSTNDVIPVYEGELIASFLEAKINVIRNAGHFNTAMDPAYIKFPLLLRNIKKHLKR